MALDRLLTLYPSLAALSSRTGGVQVWAERVTRTNLVALGDVSAYDVTNLIAESSVTLRMRWRSDVTLRSVLADGEGRVWLLERIGEVGRRRYLEVAASAFIGLTGAREEALGQWPHTTDPYTAPAGWSLVDGTNPVQNIVIRQWRLNESGDRPPPALMFTGNSDRVGFWLAEFNFVNGGYSGGIVAMNLTTPTGINAWRSNVKRNGVRCETRSGRRGWLVVNGRLIAGNVNPATFQVQSDDAWIPVYTNSPLGGLSSNIVSCFFDGSQNPGLAIGQAIRILSTEEIANG